MDRRTPAVVRGVAAALALAALVIGLPIVLAREVGWPLPTALPSWTEFTRAVTTGTVRDATIVKGLAVLVWLAWLDFTSGVLAELIGIVRGRGAVRAGGVRTVQQFAARLVTTVAIAVSLLARPTFGLAAPVDLRLAVAESPAQLPPDTRDTVRPTARPPDPPVALQLGGPAVAEHGPVTPRTSASTVYEVQRGDTLWDLAERYLGDGMRWRDIRTANLGREQPDGERIGPATETLGVGWTLLIPGASPEMPEAPMGGERLEDHLVVEPGDTLWDLAEEHLGDPHAWPRLHEENRGDAQTDGGVLDDPDLIRPGWRLDLPPPTPPPPPPPAPAAAIGAVQASPPVPAWTPPVSLDVEEEPSDAGKANNGAGPSTSTSTPPPPPAPAAATPLPSPSAAWVVETGDSDHGESREAIPVVPVAAAGTLAAGVVMTLDRLRRARLRRRQPGHRIPVPDPESARAEMRLRGTADPDAARFLDAALRELSDHLEGLDGPPDVVHVTLDQTTVSVHLTGELEDPPPGWSREDSLAWRLERPVDLDTLTASAGAPSRLPALVTLGVTSGDRVALLNLAHAGCLRVTGNDEDARLLLAAWALELATTNRADALDVVTVGIDGTPSGLERLERFQQPEELRDRLHGSPAGARSTVPDSVLLATGLPADLADAVATACRPGSSNVAAIAGDPPAEVEWVLRIGPRGRARLDPVGIDVELVDLGEQALPMTAKLLEQALHDPDQLVPLPPDPGDTELTGPPFAPVGDVWPEPGMEAPPDEPPIEVRVLGPVEVVGAPLPFRTNKTVELVVHLALRRSGADTDTLLEALWPGQQPRPARLYTEASRARKALGTTADGDLHLPDAELGRYRLAPSVGLDHERFTAAVAAARRHPEHAAEHLRRALELVRGVPLSATATEYAWATNESYRLAQEVVDAAHHLAELSLTAERWEDCTWAAEQGLLADPLAEVLIRDLMRAAAATGNTARVRTVMTRFRRQIAEDGDANDADDWLDPATIELFEALIGSVA